MTDRSHQRSRRIRRLLAGALALGLLVLWPWTSHTTWAAGRPALHGLPAFFIGLLTLVACVTLLRVANHTWRHGWRWLTSRNAWFSALGGLVLAISVVILFYTVELWRGRRAWLHVTETARLRQLPLDERELESATIPDDENFARLPLLAGLWTLPDRFRDNSGHPLPPSLGMLDKVVEWGSSKAGDAARPDWAGWRKNRRTDFALLLEPPRDGTQQGKPDPGLRRQQAEALRSQIESFADLLDELAAGAARPDCRFPTGNANPLLSDRMVQTERVLIGFMHLLETRASASLALGDKGPAFRDIQLNLRVAGHLRRQPWLIYLRNSTAAMAGALQPLWEGMQEGQWTDDELRALQNQLEGLRDLRHYARVLQRQTLAHAGLIEAAIPTRSGATTGLSLSESETRTLRWIRWLYPRGWSLQDQAAIHEFYFRRLDELATRQARAKDPESNQARSLMRLSSDPWFAVFMVPKVVAMDQDAKEHVLFEEATISMGLTACALERHRLVHGTYPTQLGSLIPEFLETPPTDPVDGRPLRYRREGGDGFRVYSIALNRADDGGDGGAPPPLAQRHGPGRHPRDFDWVWIRNAGAAPPGVEPAQP